MRVIKSKEVNICLWYKDLNKVQISLCETDRGYSLEVRTRPKSQPSIREYKFYIIAEFDYDSIVDGMHAISLPVHLRQP